MQGLFYFFFRLFTLIANALRVSEQHSNWNVMLPVILRFIFPVVLVPLVGAIISIRLEIDQGNFSFRVFIPQEMVGNPAGGGRRIIGGILVVGEPLAFLGERLVAEQQDILKQAENVFLMTVGDEPVFIPRITANNKYASVRQVFQVLEWLCPIQKHQHVPSAFSSTCG